MNATKSRSRVFAPTFMMASALIASAASAQPQEGLYVGTVLLDAVSEVNKPLSDLSFDLQLDGVLLNDVLLPAGSTWSYDTGTDLGTAWRAPAFADGGWAVGAAPLGYGASQAPIVTQVTTLGTPTLYFRKSFTVADASLFETLRLRYRRDDGIAIYLNGQLLHRDNLPTAFVGYGTLALSPNQGPSEALYYELDLPTSLLDDGVNVVAAEVHKVAVAHAVDDDLGFDLELIGVRTAEAISTLVPIRSNWRYEDTGTDLGTAWSAAGFDDTAWQSGPAQLGYGDGDEATVVSSGPDPSNKNPTIYFRHEFGVVDPSVFSDLDVSLVRDDGAVVYLNGTEIARSNMPGGGVSYSTPPIESVASNGESQPVVLRVPPTALVAGSNTLAVEIHQHAAELTPFAGSAPPSPTAAPLAMRVLLHRDAAGTVRLLKQAIQMWANGTLNPDGTLATPGHYVLLTRDELIPQFSGIGPRDGELVGRRLSAVGFDFVGTELDMTGSLGNGSTLTASVVIPANHPTHPFRHRYHPDHDNLDSKFQVPADEVAAIQRSLSFQLSDRYPPDPDDPLGTPPPGWGTSAIGGIYEETITGLHRDPITVQGVITLTRISDVGELNQ